MKPKDSKSLLLISALVPLVLLGVLVFGIYDIKAKNEEVSKILADVSRRDEEEKLVQSIKITQNESAQDLAIFDRLVLSGDKVVPLIEKLEDAGHALGLEVDIASVEKAEGKSTPKSDILTVVIESKGSWGASVAYLNAIESLPYRVMIKESNLSKVDGEWKLRIVVSIYSFN